jgi:molecular chaperone IbpA
VHAEIYAKVIFTVNHSCVSTESNVLLVRSKAAKTKGEEEYMHRGVATRTFARGFNLADDVEVTTVDFKNGMLVVNLRKIIPDHQKLKLYEINSGDATAPSDPA